MEHTILDTLNLQTPQRIHAGPAMPAQAADRASISSASSVIEIPRHNVGSTAVRPGFRQVHLPPVLTNTAPERFSEQRAFVSPRVAVGTPWHITNRDAVLGFGLLVIFDLCMHAGAGAAAATVGASGNGKQVTPLVLQMGALAGVTKAAMTTFREAVGMSSVNSVFQVLIFLVTSSFGMCPLLVAEICNLSLGGTPKVFLISALVAAVPLFFETIRDIQPKADHEGKVDYGRWRLAVFLIGTDALGGYVFARMASNQGTPISNYSVACQAGAVFGSLTFLSRAMTGIVACINRTRMGRLSNVFGVYEMVQPEPILVTEEEYQILNKGLRSTGAALFTRWL